MEELGGSELGTLSHWRDTYRREIEMFEASGDPGEVWFGEDSAERVTGWLLRSPDVRLDTPVIDIGCGNGYSLVELANEGFTNLTGVDYSAEAVTLARKVTQQFPFINFEVLDITKDELASLGGKFGVVHDKGTYDAVSLNPDDPKTQRMRYIEQVAHLMDDKGLFVITSCNWTDSELTEQFGERLRPECVIPTPQFKFGGKVGSVVSTVVFVKK